MFNILIHQSNLDDYLTKHADVKWANVPSKLLPNQTILPLYNIHLNVGKPTTYDLRRRGLATWTSPGEWSGLHAGLVRSVWAALRRGGLPSFGPCRHQELRTRSRAGGRDDPTGSEGQLQVRWDRCVLGLVFWTPASSPLGLQFVELRDLADPVGWLLVAVVAVVEEDLVAVARCPHPGSEAWHEEAAGSPSLEGRRPVMAERKAAMPPVLESAPLC